MGPAVKDYSASELAVRNQSCSAWRTCGYREHLAAVQSAHAAGRYSWPRPPWSCTKIALSVRLEGGPLAYAVYQTCPAQRYLSP